MYTQVGVEQRVSVAPNFQALSGTADGVAATQGSLFDALQRTSVRLQRSVSALPGSPP